MYNYVLVACARWENAHIAEWVEYHHSIGFQHFYIYSNDENYYDLAEVLLPYIRQKLVTYTYCPELGVQAAMYQHFQQTYLKDCNWISFLDIDEFYALPGYDDNIHNMVSDFNHMSIQLNWKLFGTSGFKTRPLGSVLRQYVLRKDELDLHTKNISHRSVVEKVLMGLWMHGWPRWVTNEAVNILGHDINSAMWLYEGADKAPFRKYLDQNYQAISNLGTVHHYSTKSEADLQRRVDRCNVADYTAMNLYAEMANDPVKKQQYINDNNQITDNYLQLYWQRHVTKALLPADFDAVTFTSKNPDLLFSAISAEESYLRFGVWLYRQYIA
jgi:hypothetical protein